jgi:hypothetical protein
MTDRKWVRSSLRHLSDLLRKQGVTLCRGTVGRLLKKLGFSLRAVPVYRVGEGNSVCMT